MDDQRVGPFRLTWASGTYVVAVAGLAALGFLLESPWPILAAALLTLPASLLALPAYYGVYGLLALVPGANPASSSGSSASEGPDRADITVTSGDPAAWFTLSTHVVGVLALSLAAVANIALVQLILRRKRAQRASLAD